jgi:hypothetical protein
MKILTLNQVCKRTEATLKMLSQFYNDQVERHIENWGYWLLLLCWVVLALLPIAQAQATANVELLIYQQHAAYISRLSFTVHETIKRECGH